MTTIGDRISELPAATEPVAGNDLLAVTNVSAPGTGKTEKRTIDDLELRGGWVGVSGWSYASATTITVPSGATALYSVGDKLRLKQGGAYKYFYIIKVENALLTVTGGSDYSVANADITDAAFSKGGGVGHPVFFNYTPTITYAGGATDPTSLILTKKFRVVGKSVELYIYGTLTRGDGNRTYIKLTLPQNTILDTAGTATVTFNGTITCANYINNQLWNIYTAGMTSDGFLFGSINYLI